MYRSVVDGISSTAEIHEAYAHMYTRSIRIHAPTHTRSIRTHTQTLAIPGEHSKHLPAQFPLHAQGIVYSTCVSKGYAYARLSFARAKAVLAHVEAMIRTEKEVRLVQHRVLLQHCCNLTHLKKECHFANLSSRQRMWSRILRVLRVLL